MLTEVWSHLLHAELPLPSRVRGRVTFLLQVNLHKLVNGELAGGSVFKFCEPKTEKQEKSPWHSYMPTRVLVEESQETLKGKPISTGPTTPSGISVTANKI